MTPAPQEAGRNTVTNTLNNGQQAAADAFYEFLFSDTKEFRLSGPAGVGKTFWMGHIIDHILPQYHEMCKLLDIPPIYQSVQMTATTNKAAEVLSSATGRPADTIHSFLGLTVYEDYATGQTKLQKNPRKWTVHEGIILFIDECSMIDAQLHSVIHEGLLNSKIVYVGDRHQLAPVMEKISPVYAGNVPVYELTEQMRTNVPELQALNEQLRNTVDTGVFQPIKIIPGIIDHLDDDQMEAMIDQRFATQTREARILAFSNKRVVEYNEHIRMVRNLPADFQPGEVLINNNIWKRGKAIVPVENEVTIVQSHGPSKILVEAGVELATHVYSIDVGDTGVWTGVEYPTDRAHLSALLKYYKRTKNWERYYYLQQQFPDLRPRDAATTHKAQGSTYEEVFIDLGNISTCNNADQTARMLYVAASRARSRVFLYGKLADKYGGLTY